MRLTVKTRTATPFTTNEGKKPYEQWLGDLKDKKAKAKIIVRIERAKLGNFGQYRDLHEGVFELKEDFGPGYRVYFGIEDDKIIVLLAGGDKSTQTRDIERAKQLWNEYLERK